MKVMKYLRKDANNCDEEILTKSFVHCDCLLDGEAFAVQTLKLHDFRLEVLAIRERGLFGEGGTLHVFTEKNLQKMKSHKKKKDKRVDNGVFGTQSGPEPRSMRVI